jgi:sortase A
VPPPGHSTNVSLEERPRMSTVTSRRPAGRNVGKGWLWTERMAWAGGIAALTFWVIAGVDGMMGTRRELQRFAALQSPGLSDVPPPDTRLWSAGRVRAWQETQNRKAPPPLAVLRIPRIGLEVPVLEGTDEWTLNRAVGLIEDTARPGTEGNSGIAGHRDGFFRGLKDIGTGDLIEIETLSSVERYRVQRTWIVDPDDASALDPTDSPSVTLVTCYPFYFVGHAPQRFIVRAVRTETTSRRKKPE